MRTSHWFLIAPLTVLPAITACDLLTAPLGAPCLRPAPLEGSRDPRAPSIIVQYERGVDVERETERLARVHGFTPRHVYTAALRGFSATVPEGTVRDLRCEASVARIDYDAVISI